MYTPKHFEETRLPVLHELMDAHPFVTLISAGVSGLIASHIPMVLERDGSEFGVLKGHVSRANPQWREFTPEVEALAIFSGPHHYISPSWYPEKSDTGKVVPTWNYAVVHAYGRVKVMDDAGWLREHVSRLTDVHEAAIGAPWKVTDAPDDYITTLLRGIVGLEFTVTRLEGKWKASQNRSEQDRAGAAAGLGELATEDSRAMKAMIEQRMRSKVE
jgi:transcriptional regulator